MTELDGREVCVSGHAVQRAHERLRDVWQKETGGLVSIGKWLRTRFIECLSKYKLGGANRFGIVSGRIEFLATLEQDRIVLQTVVCSKKWKGGRSKVRGMTRKFKEKRQGAYDRIDD